MTVLKNIWLCLLKALEQVASRFGDGIGGIIAR